MWARLSDSGVIYIAAISIHYFDPIFALPVPVQLCPVLDSSPKCEYFTSIPVTPGPKVPASQPVSTVLTPTCSAKKANSAHYTSLTLKARTKFVEKTRPLSEMEK